MLGWDGLIMARPMYGLLMTTPFQLPNDPGPLAVYYPPPVQIVDTQGNPVLDAAGMPMYLTQPTIARAEQTTINEQFKQAKKYRESYMNIQRAVFHCLDDNINDAYKVLNDSALLRWNPLIEPREIYNQITAMYEGPTSAALLQNNTLF
jgi:hypothetical protein